MGSTTFSERSGEEAALALMSVLSKLMSAGARIVKGFMGDGIIAVFGAGLRLRHAAAGLQSRLL